MADRITGKTELLSLFGYPIRHSNSPTMHNESFSYMGLDYAYLCFEVDESNLEGAVEAMRALKIRGGNVTMPNKVAVMKYLDKISPEAELCGAVNTVVNDEGVLTGYITDGIGYTRALIDNGYDFRGQKLTVVGCGGAGKPMLIQLALEGARELSVFNLRDASWERAKETVAIINEKTDCKAALYELGDNEALRAQIADSFILANATGVGMKPMEGETWLPSASYLREDLIVTDVVYVPRETKLLKMAREHGCRTLNGHHMMIQQGAVSFKLWTGLEMPIHHVKEIFGVKLDAK